MELFWISLKGMALGAEGQPVGGAAPPQALDMASVRDGGSSSSGGDGDGDGWVCGSSREGDWDWDGHGDGGGWGCGSPSSF